MNSNGITLLSGAPINTTDNITVSRSGYNLLQTNDTLCQVSFLTVAAAGDGESMLVYVPSQFYGNLTLYGTETWNPIVATQTEVTLTNVTIGNTGVLDESFLITVPTDMDDTLTIHGTVGTTGIVFPDGFLQTTALQNIYGEPLTKTWSTITINEQGVVTAFDDYVWPFSSETNLSPYELATVVVNDNGQIIALEDGGIPAYDSGWVWVTSAGATSTFSVNHGLAWAPNYPPRIRLFAYGNGLGPSDPTSFNPALFQEITPMVQTNVYDNTYTSSTNLTGLYSITHTDFNNLVLNQYQGLPYTNAPVFLPGTLWWRLNMWKH